MCARMMKRMAGALVMGGAAKGDVRAKAILGRMGGMARMGEEVSKGTPPIVGRRMGRGARSLIG